VVPYHLDWPKDLLHNHSKDYHCWVLFDGLRDNERRGERRQLLHSEMNSVVWYCLLCVDVWNVLPD
jgi:hypothetical protein